MLHLVALSFDHRVGNQIDNIFPPFQDEPYVADWKQGLPFIAIPDKADKSHTSTIQFTLPNPNQPCGCVFGIAAYRGIDTTDFETEKNYFRNQVQKALCVISSIPLFGELEQPLKESLFHHFDNLPADLPTIFDELRNLSSDPKPYSGIRYNSLFQSLRENVLLIVRALVLKKRILFFADNSEIVSKMIVAVSSLLPSYLYGEEDYPINFLDKGKGCYTFAPYVPLQFTETLNHSSAKSALMGTCSELFMEEKVVAYDILVNCRSYPATISGDIEDVKLQENEGKWMKNFLRYLDKYWAKDDTIEYIRKQFKIWMNSLLVCILRVRHISEVPPFVRPYLDWYETSVFGVNYLKDVLKLPDIDAVINENQIEKYDPIDEALIKRKLTPFEQFQAFFK